MLQLLFVLYVQKIRKQNDVLVGAEEHIKRVKSAAFSIVLPVYNEEELIERKMTNLLRLNYPNHLVEIIVVDGGSQDRTVSLARSFKDKRIIVLQQKEREGVTEAAKLGVRLSKNDIILLTDIEALFEPDVLQLLAEDLSNSEIGAVGGVQVVERPYENIYARMEFAYRKFYDMMRLAESKAYSTHHFRGELVAVRKELFPMDMDPVKGVLDAGIAYNVIRRGYRAICDERIKYLEPATETLRDRNKQKIQRGTLGQETMIQNIDMLFNPKFKTFGLFTFPCNFLMHMVAPPIFVTLLFLFPFFFLCLYLMTPIVFFCALIITSCVLIFKQTRTVLLSFIHAQYSLTMGLLRIFVFGRPRFHDQITSTRYTLFHQKEKSL